MVQHLRAVDVFRDAHAYKLVETSISITTASRCSPPLSDVRSVESFSGSMGKVCAAVYTDVVLMHVAVDYKGNVVTTTM